MNTFTQPLFELKEFTEAKKNLEAGQTPVYLTGCIDSQKCHLMYGLSEEVRYRVIITYNEIKAKEIYDDFILYDKNVYLYPPKDIIFFSADIHGNAIIQNRIKVLKRLLEGQETTIITTIDGGMDHILPLEYLKEQVIRLEEAQSIDMIKLSKKLVELGYDRQGQVEAPGQFAVRGGILDLFPLTEETPYRVEFWGDEIDTIKTFDVANQRSIERVDTLVVYPAVEFVLNSDQIVRGVKQIRDEQKEYVKKLREQNRGEAASRIQSIVAEFTENVESFIGNVNIDSYLNYFFQNTVSLFDYFNHEDAVFFIDEPLRIEEKAQAVENEFREGMIGRIEKGYILPAQMDAIYSYKEVLAKISQYNAIILSMMDHKLTSLEPKHHYDLTVKSLNSYNNNFEILVKDLEQWKKNGYRVILLSGSRTRAIRLGEDLREYSLNAFYSDDITRIVQKGEIMILYGSLHRGFEYPMLKLVIISDSDIFGAEKKKKRRKREYEGTKINSFKELAIGDYVVHENHGIGKYLGIEKIEVDKVTKDYMKIQYADGGILYILATGLDVIQKHSGADAKKPKLNKLNSQEWKHTKQRVRSAVRDVAKDLIALYAARQEKQGYQFQPDTVWQREFEEMFPYEETEDQLTAIEATKRDMESNKIMDRLICGDVGYGKTEIAIRAAFKAVTDGKQVVVLVPTTILAQQHYNTFVQRMMDFPVSIDMLSRFRTPAETKKIKEQLKNGTLDIVIGTHKVLAKDMVYKNLGLLIVDEEQRFGVTHKEKIKTMKENIDVLTLTATPIPRTLHMSLIGIRDMSVLEEPPVDRHPIQTYVLEHNEEIIREAIHRELARGGQVYYVYNRVNGIDEVANMVAKLVPDANVAFAHGQMKERELENIMFDFINGEIDVLVSTTIIETGLDISNANTMIIDDADRLGLSQLYQLRGRVGRSNRTSFAFLMYRRDKMLQEIAEKRLQAIKEFTELGSGFKIAMKDLEIRGAGNLLGAEQSGHMESVGYDLYCKMLNEAVKSMKGDVVEEENFDTTIDMDVDAYIPSTYITNEYVKLDMYKRIAQINSEEEYFGLQEELLDRFGETSHSVNNLLNIALIKARCHSVYITSLVQKGDTIKMVMFQKAKINAEGIEGLLQKHKPSLKITMEANPFFTYTMPPLKKGAKRDVSSLFVLIHELLDDLKTLIY